MEIQASSICLQLLVGIGAWGLAKGLPIPAATGCMDAGARGPCPAAGRLGQQQPSCCLLAGRLYLSDRLFDSSASGEVAWARHDGMIVLGTADWDLLRRSRLLTWSSGHSQSHALGLKSCCQKPQGCLAATRCLDQYSPTALQTIKVSHHAIPMQLATWPAISWRIQFSCL